MTIQGPLIVPRNSSIEGAGRTTSSANSPGTVIKVDNAHFGAVGYVTFMGGSGCPHGSSGSINFSPASATPAVAHWFSDATGAIVGITMNNPGGNYGSATISASLTPLTCTSNPTLTVHATHSAVIIGDTNENNAPTATFGSRLTNVTVDCNYLPNCTAIEMQNAQEQSGPMFVNAVNYGDHCLWVHGSGGVGTDNSFAFQIECNGNFTVGSSVMTALTIPVEFDNTKSRGIVGATINPVNSTQSVGLTSSTPISGCVNGSGTFIAIGNVMSSIPSSWMVTPLYGLMAYVTIAGVTPGAWNSTWPISSINSPTNKFTINGIGSCPTGVISGSSATATLVPSANIVVCSGTNCSSGFDLGQNSPTQVSLDQIHVEHTGIGVFVTGAKSSVDIQGPTVTPGNGTMFTGVQIDSANQPASVNITSLLSNAVPQFMVIDGITGANVPSPPTGQSVLAHYVSGTGLTAQLFGSAALQPLVIVNAPTSAAITVPITANNNLATFDNTGATQQITYNLPNPPVAGMTYTFLQSVATKIIVFAGSSNTIQPSGCGFSASDSISTTTSSTIITLQSINATTWHALNCKGTWNIP